MELISRTMQDMQHCEEDFPSESFISDQSSPINKSLLFLHTHPHSHLSYIFSLYWPYKVWQRQQQSKLASDSNDTCERGTSPVRFLTPAKRSSVSSNRSNLDSRSSTTSRLITPILPSPSPRRSHRITTSRSTITDLDWKSSRGKTPLV